jgi:hypothetical protein
LASPVIPPRRAIGSSTVTTSSRRTPSSDPLSYRAPIPGRLPLPRRRADDRMVVDGQGRIPSACTRRGLHSRGGRLRRVNAEPGGIREGDHQVVRVIQQRYQPLEMHCRKYRDNGVNRQIAVMCVKLLMMNQ